MDSDSTPPSETALTRTAACRHGAVRAILWTFPVTAVVTLVIGFPFPFAGYLSGWHAAVYSPVAVLIWGVLLGGFAVQALLGAAAGWLAYGAASFSRRPCGTLITWYSLPASVPAVIVLSVLCRFIHW